jgi:hypothetical protein
VVKQERAIALWRRHVAALEQFQQAESESCDFDIEERMRDAKAQLTRVSSSAYLSELRGTIGADPFTLQIPKTLERTIRPAQATLG